MSIGNGSHQGKLLFLFSSNRNGNCSPAGAGCWPGVWLEPTEGGEDPEDANEPGGQVQPETAAAFIQFTPASHSLALPRVLGWIRLGPG